MDDQLIQNIEIEFNKFHLYNIGLMSTIYNLEFDVESKDPIYMVKKLEILILIILKDIISARDLDETFFDYIMNNIHNRNILYETMKILKFE